MKSYQIAISIEGIGTDVTKQSGTLWGWNEDPGLANYDFRDVLVTDIRNTSCEADVYQADAYGSRYALSLHAHDEVASLFLFQDTDPVMNARTVLSADFFDTTLGVTFLQEVDPFDFEGTPIYVRNETILLGTWDGGTQSYINCERGFYSSDPESIFAGDLIFKKVPNWRLRRLILWEIINGEHIRLDQGLITDTPGTTDDGLRIKIPSDGILNAIKNMKIGKERSEVPNGGGTLKTVITAIQGRNVVDGVHQQSFSQIYKTSDWIARNKVMAIQVDRAVVISGNSQFDREYPQLGSRLEGEPTDDKPKIDIGSMYEIGVVSPMLDRESQAKYGHDVSFTSGCDYPYHPLTIIACLLLGTTALNKDAARFDVLNRNFGADLSWAFRPDIVEHIDEMIEETRDMKVDQFVMGEDGEPVDVWSRCQSLMKAFGFFWGTTEEGYITFARFRLMDIEDVSQAVITKVDAHDDLLAWSGASQSAQDAVVAVVGRTWFAKGRSIPVTLQGTSQRPGSLSSLREHRISYDFINEDNAEELITMLQSYSVMRYFGIPSLTLRVFPSRHYFPLEPNYNIGAHIALKDLPLDDVWILDNQGNRVAEIEGLSQFMGQITSRKRNLDDGSVELTLLLTNFRLNQDIRLRAPSLDVFEQVNANTVKTYEASSFGAVTSDVESFKPGDQVQVADRNGKLLEPGIYYTVSFVSPALSTMVLDRKLGVDLIEGDMIRLMNTGIYSNEAWVAGFPRAFCGLADSSGRLGNPGSPSTVAADIYGN